MHGQYPNQPTHDDYEDVANPTSTNLLFLAIGVAMLLGLLCGSAWTIYHLLHLHFLG
jgi:hypothetical protein